MEPTTTDFASKTLLRRRAGSGRLGLWALASLFLVCLASPAAVEAQGLHGIGFAKGCVGVTPVGGAYSCMYSIANNVDTGDGAGNVDTLTITSLVDLVCTGGKTIGPPPVCMVPDTSVDLLPSLTLTLMNGATCNGTQTLCTLPPGASITTGFFSHHTVVATDADPLIDDAFLTWQDLCNSGADNCNTADQFATASSQSTLTCPTCDTGACFTESCNEATNACERTCVSDTDQSRIDSPECFAEIGDCIWDDANGLEACQDPGDGGGDCPGGIDGVPVRLIDCGTDMQVDSTATSGGGFYQFSELSINPTTCEPITKEWQIEVDAPTGFDPVEQIAAACDPNGDDRDSDCDATGVTACREVPPATDEDRLDCGFEEPPSECDCLLVIDEEGLDNDFKTVEEFADFHGTLPSYLVNDDCQSNGLVCPFDGGNQVPTEQGNPWLLWNFIGEGDIAKLPTGQEDDEGWYMLPPEDELMAAKGWTYQEFVDGFIPQSQLDKVPNVMPLRNQDIESLVGRTCVAIVYDSDISMNYNPINGNLQGARSGKFAFTILAVETPGSLNGDPYPEVLPESKSSTSLYDVWVRIEEAEDRACLEAGLVEIHDHEPDACEIRKAVWQDGMLTVIGESDRAGADGANDHKSVMTFSVDGPDLGGDENVDPVFLEEPMTFIGGKKYRAMVAAPDNLGGRRISIQTDEGCSYNGRVRSK